MASQLMMTEVDTGLNHAFSTMRPLNHHHAVRDAPVPSHRAPIGLAVSEAEGYVRGSPASCGDPRRTGVGIRICRE